MHLALDILELDRGQRDDEAEETTPVIADGRVAEAEEGFRHRLSVQPLPT